MTEKKREKKEKKPAKGIRADFKALSTKQLIAIIAAIAIALILMVLGLATSCLGFLIIAVVLYMIPHLLGVKSVKVKAVVGVVFVVIAVLLGTFAYGTELTNVTGSIDEEYMEESEVTYEDGVYYITFSANPEAAIADEDDDTLTGEWDVRIGYAAVSMIGFGQITSTSSDSTILTLTADDATSYTSDGWYTFTVALENMADGEYEYIQIVVDGIDEDGDQNVLTSHAFTYDTGITSSGVYVLTLYGSVYITLEIALLFYIILGFSAAMRMSAGKSREKMEAEGRLYPQGYGRCKECDAMVLPGEVVCRKCGAYIEVPEELKPKKVDFVTCSECGAEVPADADCCPKCGAKFDEAEEVEVQHADGTVEVSSDVTRCPYCEQEIPDNATWCPKCGRKIKQ